PLIPVLLFSPLSPKTMTLSATTFTWSITDLEYKTEDGYIVRPFWQLAGTQGPHTAYVSGSLSFDDGTPSVPFEFVTEEIVIDWVLNAIGTVEVENIKTALGQKLEQLNNPVFSFGRPWVAPEVVPIQENITVIPFETGMSAQ
ncbi:MAG: hypothetical protein EBS30_13655, partial [Planctomycetes bacterium]|nr:hypothetical protein [Planctomycetota bacterium]